MHSYMDSDPKPNPHSNRNNIQQVYAIKSYYFSS